MVRFRLRLVQSIARIMGLYYLKNKSESSRQPSCPKCPFSCELYNSETGPFLILLLSLMFFIYTHTHVNTFTYKYGQKSRALQRIGINRKCTIVNLFVVETRLLKSKLKQLKRLGKTSKRKEEKKN